jgi:hypothetical protein
MKPTRDSFYVWAVGVAAAIAIAIYGAMCVYTRSAIWSGGTDFDLALGHSPSIACRGNSAVAMGIFWMGAGGLLHFQYFWSWREKCDALAKLGTTLSLLAVAGGIVYFVFHFWLD